MANSTDANWLAAALVKAGGSANLTYDELNAEVTFGFIAEPDGTVTVTALAIEEG